MRLYVGLVHYPVYNKNYQVIASAVTTVDLHDIARVARTYGVRKFFVITPLVDQQMLVERVRKHWTDGYGARYNQDRQEALKLVSVVLSLEEAVKTIAASEGETPLIIATAASKHNNRSISYHKARSLIENEKVVVLIFGTGWGLDSSVMKRADYILDPVSGKTDYRHLSVRSAASIILDRLAGIWDIKEFV